MKKFTKRDYIDCVLERYRMKQTLTSLDKYVYDSDVEFMRQATTALISTFNLVIWAFELKHYSEAKAR
jgi:hypothetical protein